MKLKHGGMTQKLRLSSPWGERLEDLWKGSPLTMKQLSKKLGIDRRRFLAILYEGNKPRARLALKLAELMEFYEKDIAAYRRFKEDLLPLGLRPGHYWDPERASMFSGFLPLSEEPLGVLESLGKAYEVERWGMLRERGLRPNGRRLSETRPSGERFSPDEDGRPEVAGELSGGLVKGVPK